MKKVFISYRQTQPDAALAHFVADYLRQRNLEVFIDTQIPVGEEWAVAIDRALRQCDAFIVLLSQESVKSDMVRHEVKVARQMARQRGRRLTLLPVRLDTGDGPTELPYEFEAWLGSIQHGRWQEDDEATAAELYRALGVDTAPAPEVEKPAAEDFESYRRWALDQHLGVDLLGVGAGEVRLRLEEVYVPLRLAGRPGHGGEPLHNLEEIKKIPAGRGRELPAGVEDLELEDLFSHSSDTTPHVLILGTPGAGKTTALRKLLRLCLSQPSALGLDPHLLPVFLELRHFSADDLEQPFRHFLERELRRTAADRLPPDEGARLWRRGRLLLLLDGLDEIPNDDLRARVCGYLKWILEVEAQRGLRAVISCRRAGYGNPSGREATAGDASQGIDLGPTFLATEIRPLGAEQVKELVRRWFQEVERALPEASPREAQEKAQSLLAALDGPDYGSQQLKVLVSSPLLLTLLCVVVLRGGEMPRRRAAFYEQCLRVLLSSWGKTQGRADPILDLDTALALLRPLAYRLHTQESRELSTWEFVLAAEETLDELGRKQDPFQVLRWLHQEAGVLDLFAPERYGFVHLGLQEYLSAQYVAHQGETHLEEMATRWPERWWREVILLLAGLSSRPLFARLARLLLASDALWEDPELLRSALVEAPEVDLAPFLELLTEATEPRRQAAVLRLLHGSADLEPGKALAEKARGLVRSADPDVRALASQVLARTQTGSSPSPASGLYLVGSRDQGKLARAIVNYLEPRGIPVWREMASAETLFRQARATAVLVAPEVPSPWQDPTVGACLRFFARKGRPVLALGPPGARDKFKLPDTVNWVDLGAGSDEAGLQTLVAVLTATPDLAQAPLDHGVSGQPFTEPNTGIRFLWIPGGRFKMGSEGITKDELPVHRVRVSPFWLGETPVTNHQYGPFLKATGHGEPPYWRDERFSSPEQPVVGVSWHDAGAFCEWLSSKAGVVARLPSEAQWEWAARGSDGRPYPWGTETPDSTRACFEASQPAPVGSFPGGRGPFGTLDQAGNVWEWCLDVWDSKAYDKRKDREWTDPVVEEGDGEVFALRGGGWIDVAEYLPSAYRSRSLASNRLDGLGFRVAVVPASTLDS